jgi:hypothetical protein
MRFWFVVALAIVTGSVFFCLYAEPVPGGGIGDGGPARNATLYGRVPGRNLSNCSRLGRLTNFVGGGILWWMSISAFAVRRRSEAGN